MTQTSLKLLAFDLGAESGRAILGDFDGERIELSEVHRFPNTPVPLPDGLHWNVLGLWSEIRKGLALAVQTNRRQPGRDGPGYLGRRFWSARPPRRAAGKSLPLPRRRTDGMMEAAFQRISKADIFALTGIQFMQLNTLYQLLAMAMQNSPPGRRGNLPDHARPAQLLADRQKSLRIHQRHHHPVLRSAPEDLGPAAARPAGHPLAHLPRNRAPGNGFGRTARPRR